MEILFLQKYFEQPLQELQKFENFQANFVKGHVWEKTLLKSRESQDESTSSRLVPILRQQRPPERDLRLSSSCLRRRQLELSMDPKFLLQPAECRLKSK